MLFCQLDYPQELGTRENGGEVITIAQDGCAVCSVTSMLVNVFGQVVNPLTFVEKLDDAHGFVYNGEGNFDILDWTAINKIYPDISVLFNKPYYNPPNGTGDLADMAVIDEQLSKGYSVIVGVSFNHNPQEPVPTHYVELYRKNADGTYQMRDPMFRDSENDTVFDDRYAVNGMSVANAILQVIAYTGPLPAQKDGVVLTTYFKVGDEIKVDTAVPTGKSPETISFNYGQISLSAPAKVTGIENVNSITYYLIDQTYIGGGTGFANAAEIDDHAIKTGISSVQDNINIPLVLTSDQVNKDKANAQTEQEAVDPLKDPQLTVDPQARITELTAEKTELVAKVQELTTKYQTDLEKYQGLVAGGFEKIDDVLKALEEVGSENTGVKKQLVQVYRRNAEYHRDIAAKDEEDATAIEVGMKYEYLYKDMKQDLSFLAKVFKTKPSLNSIIFAAERIKEAYEKVVGQLKKNEVKQAVKTATDTVEAIHTDEGKTSNTLFLAKLFSFSWL